MIHWRPTKAQEQKMEVGAENGEGGKHPFASVDERKVDAVVLRVPGEGNSSSLGARLARAVAQSASHCVEPTQVKIAGQRPEPASLRYTEILPRQPFKAVARVHPVGATASLVGSGLGRGLTAARTAERPTVW